MKAFFRTFVFFPSPFLFPILFMVKQVDQAEGLPGGSAVVLICKNLLEEALLSGEVKLFCD